jgi:hypothetical protein
MFGLVQAGATLVFFAFAQAGPALFWVLLAGVCAFAFLAGVRLRTWWWVLGPVFAYGVPAAVYMISANAQFQAMQHRSIEGLTWDWFVVVTFAVFVVAPCMLAAAAGVAWAAVSASRAAGRRRGGCPKRWSSVRRFFTVEDAADPEADQAPPV